MDKTKILIVDDKQENIFALSQLIQSPEIEILSALDAQKALELLINNEFALALLDVNMPNVTGFELARLIRGVRRFRHLPVIFVTAHQQDYKIIFEGYETGAVDLLFKPLDPHIVRTKVDVFVQLDQQKKLLREQMKKLEVLKQQADAASIAKSQFLANMSHEIRTPLGAVLGFSDVLVQGQATEQQKEECAFAIRRNGQLLLRIINDILDLSKVEAGHAEFEEANFNLEEVIRDVESTLRLKAEEKGIYLKTKVEGTLAPGYISDQNRIKQILLNIIGNAIKFTRTGGVNVLVAAGAFETHSPTTQAINITVSDTGIGLSEEQAEKLFQAFSQADPSTRRKFGGTGLGLAISQQIAAVAGGKVFLKESKLGVGSVFEIQLNLKISTAESKAMVFENRNADNLMRSQKWSQKQVLVVDDSIDNRTLLDLYLKPYKLNITFADNGLRAVEMAQAQKMDLILMDIQMPEMDGYEATEKIRANGFTGPIMALTAHALREEHEKCRKAGCNDVLTKPINRTELLYKMSEFLEART